MSGGAASKRKGSKFERDLCTKLSLWISNGKHNDLLWRSAMSGGRATRRIVTHGAQQVSGDICATHALGHNLTDFWHIEAKHVRDMQLPSLILKNTGFLATEWRRCYRQAKSHNKHPMMIVKQNLMPEIVLLDMCLWPSFMFLPHSGIALNRLSDVLSTPYLTPRRKMPDEEPEEGDY